MQTTSPAFEENAPHAPVDAGPRQSPSPRLRQGRAVAPDSVQHARTAVAETGAFVPAPSPERPTTSHPLAGTEIVLPRATRRVGAHQDARDLLRAERRDGATGNSMPRDIPRVTGSSRSAGAGPMPEPGAHGPRRPHVVLAEDDPAVPTPEGYA